MEERNDQGVRQERSGWRDLELSQRHRDWGFNCPAVDVDFLAVEYDIGKPVALVEYKRFTANFPDLQHPTYRAICDLGTGYHSLVNGLYRHNPLPVLIAIYWPGCWAFRSHPLNDSARNYFGEAEFLSEKSYVQRLYRIRRRVLAQELEPKLMDILPEQPELGEERSLLLQFGEKI